jgi:hypothetical protein
LNVRQKPQTVPPGLGRNNARRSAIILLLSAVSAGAYLALALTGDLREHIAWFLTAFAALSVLMLVAWRLVCRDPHSLKWAIGAALLFRIVAAMGPPALSDDVYRYVWDGRVQVHGFHPYRYAPSDPALADLRDEHWEQINHPELKTIYPPAAQMVFLLLASLGAGPVGMKLFLGLVDFGVVLAMGRLLRLAGLPRDRLILYAWNPLAVLETAGSGHIEPVGILLVLLAAGWIIKRRTWLSTLALAVSIQVKLLPLVLVPGQLKRGGRVAALLLPIVVVGLALPYALTGPALGSGLMDYAERWERNAFVFAGVQWVLERLDTASYLKPAIGALQDRLGDSLPWDFLYRHVWPRDVAKLALGLVMAVWIYTVTRRRLDPLQESLLLLGAVILLSPTVHPWYLLWILPFAAARLSWGWLLLCLTVSLAYCGGGQDVPWPVRCVEYVPPLTVMLLGAVRSRPVDRSDSVVC